MSDNAISFGSPEMRREQVIEAPKIRPVGGPFFKKGNETSSGSHRTIIPNKC